MISYTYTNTVGGKEAKVAHLDDSDPVWVSVRHLHMKDAIDTLMTDFGKFAQEHAGFSGYDRYHLHSSRLELITQWRERQCERSERYAGQSASIPNAKRAVLASSRHGTRVHGTL